MSAIAYTGTNASEDPLDGQAQYGNDAGIQFRHRNAIKIVHKLKFADIWCDHCSSAKQRKFAMLTENALIVNNPSSCSIMCPGLTGCYTCCSLPPNCLCPGNDHIAFSFFDRGVFDRQGLCFTMGCLNGEPEVFPGETKHVCCCIDCPTCYNEWASCWWPCCCGQRVRLLPAQQFCYCIPARVNGLLNCFSLCGAKSGEPCPCCLSPMVDHLLDGEPERFHDSYAKARAEWVQFTGKV